jgi:type IV secretory pathway VirJ component
MKCLALALTAHLLFLTCILCFASEEVQTYGRCGKVTLYSRTPRPNHVVLFVSGDGGWNQGVVDMAEALASADALVVGIDINYYLSQVERADEKCSYPAADFETLSKFIQKKVNYPEYVTPVLFGYSSGATLVYATLVQAPPTTFRGAISLGFCPDLPLKKPLCRGSGLEWEKGPKGIGYAFLPAASLEVPWIAFQGTIDQVCNPEVTENFVRQVKNGQLVLLPKVGHGFEVQKNWMPQFKKVFSRITATVDHPAPSSSDGSLNDLPLVEVPAAKEGTDLFAVHISGDGGYGVTDRGLSTSLAEHSIPVVCLNALYYFWKPRTPEGAANDLNRIILHYCNAWRKHKVILIGYSMGADVLPFMINRLSDEVRAKIAQVVFLGLGSTAQFEFHLSDWLGSAAGSGLAVLPEVKRLKGMPILCFYGADDADALCKQLDSDLVILSVMAGGHRIGSNFTGIVDSIVEAVPTKQTGK